jgi:hypothetical protein
MALFSPTDHWVLPGWFSDLLQKHSFFRRQISFFIPSPSKPLQALSSPSFSTEHILVPDVLSGQGFILCALERKAFYSSADSHHLSKDCLCLELLQLISLRLGSSPRARLPTPNHRIDLVLKPVLISNPERRTIALSLRASDTAFGKYATMHKPLACARRIPISDSRRSQAEVRKARASASP